MKQTCLHTFIWLLMAYRFICVMCFIPKYIFFVLFQLNRCTHLFNWTVLSINGVKCTICEVTEGNVDCWNSVGIAVVIHRDETIRSSHDTIRIDTKADDNYGYFRYDTIRIMIVKIQTFTIFIYLFMNITEECFV